MKGKSALQYNMDRWPHDIGFNELTKLVRYWQAGHGLLIDGKLGPRTLASMQSAKPSEVAMAVVQYARAELGNGEEGANNCGPHIARYRGLEYQEGRSYGAWCAWFASWCLNRALDDAGFRGPFPIGGAKRLVQTLSNSRYGRAVNWRKEGVIPGDLIAWDRGAPGGWEGHVVIVSEASDESGRFRCIDGNRGPYPAVVTERWEDLDDRPIKLVARPL